jgi:ppGpp synthetase/RelA/SpoT-type nucleotidyltranferase
MNVPSSFGLAFIEHREIGAEVERLAGARLQGVVCKPNKWLFTDRLKSEESALAKLQMSPVRSLSEMRDLYATTIVVPTRAEIGTAVESVKAAFPDSSVVERRKLRAETFLYDDTHMTARLGDLAAGLPSVVSCREFEIQIKTGLQFAWWRATHEVLYKGAEKSWQLARVAGQTRAALELLDAQLADLRGAAKLQLTQADDEVDEDYARIASLLELWSPEQRPEDVTRFVRAVTDLSRVARVPSNELEAAVDSCAELRRNPEITPLQAVLAGLVTTKGAGFLDRLKGDGNRPAIYVLVTDELVSAVPAVAAVGAERRALLT